MNSSNTDNTTDAVYTNTWHSQYASVQNVLTSTIPKV